jgi:hypothetical protein
VCVVSRERWQRGTQHAHTYTAPRAQVPVRAVVLPLHDDEAALQIHTTIRHALSAVVAADGVWWQREHLLHATLWHASTREVRWVLCAVHQVSCCCWCLCWGRGSPTEASAG